MQALVLRLDAPLMSFGSVIVDHHDQIHRFPGTAMLVGLLANALGWHHGDFACLQALQSRLEHAARWDIAPKLLVDYQTVDLGQPHMLGPGWTTTGRPEARGGGPAKMATHPRLRRYWMDGLATVVLTLNGPGEPDLDTLQKGLERPLRPLFIGRKNCLPARPLLDAKTPILEGDNVRTILGKIPVLTRPGAETGHRFLEAAWPAYLSDASSEEIRRVYDLRDWAHQIPAGSRWQGYGLIGVE